MKIPVVGPLFIKSAISRFASIFSILQASGVDILQTMDILSETIGNAAISTELDGIRDRLAEGHGIAGPLGSARYFTPMLINMVAIGEESGNLEELMQDVAQHYDTEVEYAMKKLSEAIGPVLTIGLAAVVGFFALAIFLPMWDLTLMAKVKDKMKQSRFYISLYVIIPFIFTGLTIFCGHRVVSADKVWFNAWPGTCATGFLVYTHYRFSGLSRRFCPGADNFETG